MATSSHKVFTPDLSAHGKSYQGLASANPYSNPQYRQSWMQKFLSKLGFRTNYDAYLESMNLQAKEYDNALLQKEYDEKYNSPIEQAQRERAAGINPDLSGDVSAGEASPMGDDGNPPVAPVADDLQIAGQFASGVLSAVQAAFGIFGDIQSIQSLKLDNENKKSQLVKDAFNMVIPNIYDQMSNSKDGSVSRYALYDQLKVHYGHSMSKKRFDRFAQRVADFANSAEGWNMVYSQQSNKAKARKSMFQEISDPDQYSEWDDVMTDIADELASLAFDVQKKSLENSKKYENDVHPLELENKEYYEEAFDPTTAAKLQSNPDDLKIRSNEREMSDYTLDLRSSFKKIMSDLDRRADKGNKVAPIVKAVLSVWLMGMMPTPSFSRSSGPKGSSMSFGIK